MDWLPFSAQNPVIGNLGRFALYGLPIVLLVCAAVLAIQQVRSHKKFSALQIAMLVAMVTVAVLIIIIATFVRDY